MKSKKNLKFLTQIPFAILLIVILCIADAVLLYQEKPSTISAMLIVFGIILVILFISFDIQNRKKTAELQAFSEKIKGFLLQSGNLSFDFDVKTLTLTASSALNDFLGEPLPENWFSVISNRVQLHPEFDYKAVVDVYRDLMVSDDYRELVACINIRGKGMRWVRISFAAVRTSGQYTTSIYGVMTDITEAYMEQYLLNEEHRFIIDAIVPFVAIIGTGNLSQNSYAIIKSLPFVEKTVPKEGDFDRMILQAAGLIPESHRQLFRDTFSRDSLLRMNDVGKRMIELEHPASFSDDGLVRSYLTRVCFLKKIADGDIRIMAVVIDITENGSHPENTETVIDTTADLQESLVADTVSRTDEASAPGGKVVIRTFGYFDVFVNGQPISFVHDKSKEMLAVLVDRRGGYISTSEMIGYLWEDEPATKTTQSRCRQVASRLKKILDKYGIGDIIETVNGQRRIIPEKVDCDYFKYLNDKTTYQYLFNGSYMQNYSWSETTLADLENSKPM